MVECVQRYCFSVQIDRQAKISFLTRGIRLPNLDYLENAE